MPAYYGSGKYSIVGIVNLIVIYVFYNQFTVKY